MEEPRCLKLKLDISKRRDGRIQDNKFREDQGRFYRNIQGKQEQKGKEQNIDRCLTFWAGLWEDESLTPHKKMGAYHSTKD